MEKIFSYGTLMFPDIQKDLFGKSVIGKADILHEYIKKSIIIDGENYPYILSQKNSQVEGFVLEVSVDELLKTDKYEGEEYKRIRVLLKSGLEAWVYVLNEENLNPS